MSRACVVLVLYLAGPCVGCLSFTRPQCCVHRGAESNVCMVFSAWSFSASPLPALPTPSSSHSDQGQSICAEKGIRRHLPKRTPSPETIYSRERPWVKRRQKRVPPTGMTPRYCQRRGRDRPRRQTVLICPNASVRMCLCMRLCLYRSLFRAYVLSLCLSTRRGILKHAGKRIRTRAPDEL